MRYILAFAALSSALFGQNGTTSHDDPIIISQGSVYVNFSSRTRAIEKNQWGISSGGRYLYNQHAHISSGTLKNREIRSYFFDGKPVPKPMSRLQSSLALSDLDQSKLRIEVFLKGKKKATGLTESLGTTPQIILSAVNVPTACCMHPWIGTQGATPAKDCPTPLPPPDKIKYPWSWQISSDQPLTNFTTQQETRKRGIPLERGEYLHPDYDEVTVDHWEVYKMVGARKQQLYTSVAPVVTGKGLPTTKPGPRCSVIEVCANDHGAKDGSTMCISDEFECRLKADPLPGGGPVFNKP